MKRIIIGVMVLALALSGCATGGSEGNGNQGAVDNGGDQGEETVELTFWRYSYLTEDEAMQKLIDDFEAENPNIKIKFELYPNDQYETKIRTALSGQSAPDIMAIDAPTIASYADSGAIIPLDEYMNDPEYQKDDIFAPVLEAMTYDEKIWAAPNNDASVAMFYNIKMFEEAGIDVPSQNPDEAWTWDQVLEAAKKLNDPDSGVYGWSPTPWGFAGHEGTPFAQQPFLWQAGAEILNDENTTASGYLDSEEAKKAVEFFQSLYNEHNVSPKELPEDAFPNEKVAIHADMPNAFSYFAENYPDFKLGEDYGVAPLWKDEKQVTPNGSWNMAITSQSEHPDEAWEFIKYVTGVEGSKVWYELTNNVPARQTTVDAFEELNEYPLNIFVQQSANYAKPRPVTPDYPVISESIRLMFEAVALGNATVDDAVAEAVEKINAAVEK